MKKIVCFGNSLTYGYLVNKGYIDFLKEYFLDKFNFINSGIPGDTIIDGFRRIEHSVLKYNPDITIIEFGVNDAFSGITVPTYKSYLEKIIQIIPKEKIIMIPHTLYEKIEQKTVKPYYFEMKQIAQKFNLDVIDVSKYTLQKEELLYDLLHPNEKGYKIYAQEAQKVLELKIDD